MAMIIYCDNVSAVYLFSNLVQHQRTKNIKIDLHFIRDKIVMGHVHVLHIPSFSQYVDIFTKGLPSSSFIDFLSSLNIRDPPVPTIGGLLAYIVCIAHLLFLYFVIGPYCICNSIYTKLMKWIIHGKIPSVQKNVKSLKQFFKEKM